MESLSQRDICTLTLTIAYSLMITWMNPGGQYNEWSKPITESQIWSHFYMVDFSWHPYNFWSSVGIKKMQKIKKQNPWSSH